MLRRLLASAVVMFCCTTLLNAQIGGPAGQRQRFPGVGGAITAIENQTLTLNTFQGQTAKIQISGNTLFFRGQQQGKASDLKVGDTVFVMGEQKDGVWMARAIRQPDMTRLRQELGRRFITGEVKKIEETRLTILRPDGEIQVIEVDESTSFRNEKRESITLADIKAGDRVSGPGEVKNGNFIPRILSIGAFMGGFGPGPQGGTGSQQQPSPSDGKGR